jgi:hypothetical protein
MDTPDLYNRFLQEPKRPRYRFSLWTLLVFVLLPAEKIQAAEPAQIAAELKKNVVAAQSKSGSRKKKDDENTSSAPVKPAPPKPLVKPRQVRLHLHNGSTISGRLAIKQITLETRYGTLTIPIEKIKSITPGLGSNNRQLGAKLGALVEKLGSEVFAERETAEKELLGFGPPVRNVLKRRLGGNHEERQHRLKKLLAALEVIAAEHGDEFASGEPAWIERDTVETAKFTVYGSISPKSFQVDGKRGLLRVKLGDIRRISRRFEGPQVELGGKTYRYFARINMSNVTAKSITEGMAGWKEKYKFSKIPRPLRKGFSFLPGGNVKGNTTRFTVADDGIVLMVLSGRPAGGGGGGEWMRTITSPASMTAQGWQPIGKIDLTSHPPSVIYSRVCRKGESFVYSWEKYIPPALIVPAK